jgi:hypothetical protein
MVGVEWEVEALHRGIWVCIKVGASLNPRIVKEMARPKNCYHSVEIKICQSECDFPPLFTSGRIEQKSSVT